MPLFVFVSSRQTCDAYWPPSLASVFGPTQVWRVGEGPQGPEGSAVLPHGHGRSREGSRRARGHHQVFFSVLLNNDHTCIFFSGHFFFLFFFCFCHEKWWWLLLLVNNYPPRLACFRPVCLYQMYIIHVVPCVVSFCLSPAAGLEALELTGIIFWAWRNIYFYSLAICTSPLRPVSSSGWSCCFHNFSIFLPTKWLNTNPNPAFFFFHVCHIFPILCSKTRRQILKQGFLFVLFFSTFRVLFSRRLVSKPKSINV